METSCQQRCLGGTDWEKIADSCVSPAVCVLLTEEGYFGQIKDVPCSVSGKQE